MKEQYENLGVLAQFAFGILAALVFHFFVHDRIVVGLLLGLCVAMIAVTASQDDIRKELESLKTFPRNFARTMHALRTSIKAMPASATVAWVMIRTATEKHLTKVVRHLRQKKLLRRNRVVRERKLISAY